MLVLQNITSHKDHKSSSPSLNEANAVNFWPGQ